MTEIDTSAEEGSLKRLARLSQAAFEAKKAYGRVQAQVVMESAFQQGLEISRGKNEEDGFEVEYDGKPATMRVLDKTVGLKPQDESNIRFIIVGKDDLRTHLADVSLNRKEPTEWQAHEVSDVERDSDRGGHGSSGWVNASGLENPDKSLIGEYGLSVRPLKVLQVVDTVYRSGSSK